MTDATSRLLAAFYSTPWAILPSRLSAMQSVMARWGAGVRLSSAEIAAAVGTAPQAAEQRREQARNQPGAVAVIPVYGILAPRIHQVSDVSGEGAMTYERLKLSLRAALASDEVGAIVLDIDSPGGATTGCMEIADEIYAARSQKKIVAVANHLAASAAYWIGSACEEFVAAPSADVGCIGIYGIHQDASKALEEAGLKHTVIRSAKYKAEGLPFEPLADETRDYLQGEVDRLDGIFVDSLVRNLGIKASVIRSEFGEGRCLDADTAKKRGMVHRVATLDETIARLASSTKAQRPRTREAAALRLAELS